MSPAQSRPEHNVVSLRAPRVPVTELQGTLALDLQPRQDPPATRPGPAPLALVEPTEPTRRRVAEAWGRRFGQAAVEIVGGDRPATQLLRWTTPAVYDELNRRARVVAQAGQHRPGAGRVQPVRPRIMGVHTCFLGPDVVEAAIHVRYGQRSRALAARFEWVDERWLCTALEFA